LISLIRRPTLTETDQVLHIWNVCFPQEQAAATDWYFARVYAPENTLCYFERGAMAACLQTVPYPVRMRGRTLLAMTLTGVSTLPEFRGKGFARDLMKAALADMRERGAALCFLYTDIPDFYRQYGWETCTQNCIVHFPGLDDGAPVGFRLAESPPPVAELDALYQDWLRGVNGYVLRTRELWERRLDELRCDGARFVSLYRGDVLSGFAAVRGEGQAEWEEAYWRDEDALHALRRAFDKEIVCVAPAGFPLPSDSVPEVRRGNMFRTADPKLLLQGTPVSHDGLIKICVADSFTGDEDIYTLTAANGKLDCRKDRGPFDLKLDSAALIRIVSGALEANEALNVGRISGDGRKVSLLGGWFPPQNNFMFEIS
jgi:predicted acetyltransferase